MAKRANKPVTDVATATETIESAEDIMTENQAVADAKKPEQKKAVSAKKEPVFTTIIQVGGKEYDITGIAEKALKSYKSVHKRKNVTDFVVYVKPEENAVYYTVNGEGAEEYKIEL